MGTILLVLLGVSILYWWSYMCVKVGIQIVTRQVNEGISNGSIILR